MYGVVSRSRTQTWVGSGYGYGLGDGHETICVDGNYPALAQGVCLVENSPKGKKMA